MNTKKRLWALPALLLCALCLAGFATGAEVERPTIAIEVGTLTERAAREACPDADFLYVDTAANGYLAVETMKADAYAGDLMTFECAQRSGLEGLVASEPIGETGSVAVGVSPAASENGGLDFVNRFLRDLRE